MTQLNREHDSNDIHHLSSVLKIGDRISLFSEEANGYLASLSVAKRNVVINPQELRSFTSQFEKCVFLVEPADEEFHSMALSSIDNRIVSYGQHIQLRHIHSGGLLVLRKRIPSEHESNCLRIEITQDTSKRKLKDAWWRVLPQYKVRTEGERVMYGDKILFCSYKAEEQYIHFSEHHHHNNSNNNNSNNTHSTISKPSSPKTSSIFSASKSWQRLRSMVVPHFEVNATSMQSNRIWTLCAFDSTTNIMISDQDHTHIDDTVIQVGDPLVIFHREAQGFITAEYDAHKQQHRVHVDPRPTGTNFRIAELEYSSNALWIIEQQLPWKGGLVRWQSSQRIKHLASGKYLAVEYNQINHNNNIDNDNNNNDNKNEDEKNQNISKNYRITLSNSPIESTSLFTFIPFEKFDDLVRTTSFARIGITPKDSQQGYLSIDFSRQQNNDQKIPMYYSSTSNYPDVYSVQTIPREEQDNLNKVVGSLPPLNNLVKSFNNGKYPTSIIFDDAISSLSRLCNFCTRSKETDPFIRDGIPLKQNQRLLVDQNVDQITLRAVAIPFRECYHFVEGCEANHAQISITDLREEKHSKLFIFCRLVYRLLRQMSKENPSISTRIMERCRRAGFQIIDLIQSQIGHRIQTAEAMLMLVKDNPDLLETISEEQIDNFISLMRSRPQVARYLNFLCVLCVCQNRPFMQNQQKILDRFIRENHDLLIETRVRYFHQNSNSNNSDNNKNSRQDNDQQESNSIIESAQVIVMNPQRKRDEWIEIGTYCDTSGEEMVSYLEYLTLLYSCLCQGRNEDAIQEISQYVSYEEILIILRHPHVSYSIKSAYLDLVVNLYLVRDPLHSVLNFSTVQSYHTISSLDSDTSSQQPSLSQMDKKPESPFDDDHEQLKQYALSIVKQTDVLIASQVDKNHYMTKIVSLVKTLVRYGVIPIVDLPQIMATLVQILDGRNDAVDETDYSVYASRVMGNHLGTNDMSSEYDKSSGDDNINNSSENTDHHSNLGHNNNNTVNHVNGNVGDNDDYDNDNEIESDSSSEMSLQPKLGSVQKSLWDRFAVTERNLKIMECKLEVIQAISLILNACTKSNIALILGKTKHNVIHVGEKDLINSSIPFMDQKKLLQTFFTRETLVQLQEAIFDTLMYRYHPLVDKALLLLFRLFGYSREISEALSHVTLLHTEENVKAFEQISYDIVNIRRISKQQLSPSNLKTISEMIEDLISFMKKKSDDPEQLNEAQHILLNAQAHVPIVQLLQTPGVHLNSEGDDLLSCFRTAYQFLTWFCQDNPRNQSALYPYLQCFLGQLGHELRVASTIATMFQDNRHMCSQAPSDVIIQFVRLIVRNGQKPRYLRFLRSITSVNGYPVAKNQVNVMKCLMENRQNTVLLFADYEEKQWRNRLLDQIEDQSSSDYRSSTARELIDYHLELMNLLAECCLGLIAGNEITCQSLLPLDSILEVMATKSMPMYFVIPYIRFLNEVYIMAERQSGEVISHPWFWEAIDEWRSCVVNYQDHLIEAFEEGPNPLNSKTDEYKYIFQGILSCISTLMKQHQQHEYSELLLNQERKNLLRKLILEVIHLKNIISHRTETSNLSLYIIQKFFDPIDLIITDAINAQFIHETDFENEDVEVVESFEVESLQNDSPNSTETTITVPMRVKSMLRQIQKLSSQYNNDSEQGFIELAQILYKSDHQFLKRLILISDSKDLSTEIKPDVLYLFQTFLQPELFHPIKQQKQEQKQEQENHRNQFIFKTQNNYMFNQSDDPSSTQKRRQEVTEHQNWMDQMGATLKFLSLLETNHSKISAETVRFGIRLLEFGNDRVQNTIRGYLLQRHDEKLFYFCKNKINRAAENLQKMKRNHNYQEQLGSRTVYSGASHRMSSVNFYQEEHNQEFTILNDTRDLLRLLQLFCEGHNSNLQDYLRFQHDNNHSLNIIRETALLLQPLVQYLRLISSSSFSFGSSVGGTSVSSGTMPRRQFTSTVLGGQGSLLGGSSIGKSGTMGRSQIFDVFAPVIHLLHQCLETLIEYVQGPNRSNQHTLISAMVVSVLDKLLSIPVHHKLDHIMSSAVVLLVSLLEGNSDDQLPSIIIKQVSIDRLIGKLYSIWKRHCALIQSNNINYNDNNNTKNSIRFHHMNEKTMEEDEDSWTTGFNIFIFLKTLDDFLPHAKILKKIKRYLEIDAFRFFAYGIGRVEIARGDATEWVYFRIPDMWENLSSESKRELQWQVSRENQISKLNDFVYRAEDIIFETSYLDHLHHKYADNSRMQFLFSNASTIADTSIIVAIVINILMLAFFIDDGSLSWNASVSSSSQRIPSYEIGVTSSWLYYPIRGILFALCVLLCCLAVLSFAEFWVSKVPIIQFKGLRRDSKDESKSRHKKKDGHNHQEDKQKGIGLVTDISSDDDDDDDDSDDELDRMENIPVHNNNNNNNNNNNMNDERKRIEEDRKRFFDHYVDSYDHEYDQMSDDSTTAAAAIVDHEEFNDNESNSMNVDPEENDVDDVSTRNNENRFNMKTMIRDTLLNMLIMTMIKITRYDDPQILMHRILRNVPFDSESWSWSRIRILGTNTMFLYRLMLVVASVLSVVVSPLFTAVYLLAIIERFRELKNVVQSLTLHGKSLLLTAILGVIIIYLYTVVGFIFFRPKFYNDDLGDENQCETLFRCLIFTLVYGIRAGGGVGEVMQPGEWGWHPSLVYNTARIIYDASFFVLVIVVLMNIVFGIIIDTFAELRDDKLRIEEDMYQRCFICGIGADQFDRHADGFQRHVRRDHNMWGYIFLMHHLRLKPQEEYTGQESYVANKLKLNDLSFFPVNQTSVLPADRE